MCRNIKILFNFDPPVTAEEIRAASLQFVRKISGFTKPTKANESMFMTAVDDITGIPMATKQTVGDTKGTVAIGTQTASAWRCKAVAQCRRVSCFEQSLRLVIQPKT